MLEVKNGTMNSFYSREFKSKNKKKLSDAQLTDTVSEKVMGKSVRLDSVMRRFKLRIKLVQDLQVFTTVGGTERFQN